MSEWAIDIKAVNADGTITVELEEFLRVLGNQPINRTTAQIDDKEDFVNITDKRVGKMIFNTTTGLPLWADASTDVGTWSLATGIVAHTPS